MKMYFSNKLIYRNFLSRAFLYFLILFSLMAVLVCIFSRELLAIFATAGYFDAARAIPPLAIAAVFSASVQVTALGISISRNTKYIALSTLATAVLNTLLNFLLIPKYGIVGAGWSTAISYLFLTSIYLQISQKFIPFLVLWNKIIKLALISGIAIFISPFLWDYGFWSNFAIKITQFAIYLIFLYLLGVIEKKEVLYFRSKLIAIKTRHV